MPGDGWFNAEDPAPGPRREFVMAVRAIAQTWSLSNLSVAPSATGHYEYGAGHIIEVDLPGVTCSRRFLRVIYTPAQADGRLLDSEWADRYIFDGPEDPHRLLVHGVAASPAQSGEWAASWIESQLRRPVVRREWDRPEAGLARLLPAASKKVAAIKWYLTDTNELLDGRQGLIWWGLVRRPPSREVEERPDRTSR